MSGSFSHTGNDAHQMETLDYILGGSVADYLGGVSGSDLLARKQANLDWLDARYRYGVDPYSKSSDGPILAECRALDRLGRVFTGVNMASQDYLALSCHPAIKQAAKDAVDCYGVHSAGSPALMGNTKASVELERRLAEFFKMKDCTVFATGWAAGYGLIKALIRETDHIVIDQLSHASLMEGARNATRQVHVFPHLSVQGLERRLKRIRGEHPEAGILVVTESLFSMDSDTPDIAAHQKLARDYGATLMVDAAHDMGCMGPTGRGHLEMQGMLGKVDLLMGSFSKTFASNGGYVATNHPALKQALRYACGPLTFSNAISPVQASIVLKALDIIESHEGAQLREAMMANAIALRDGLTRAGFQVMGAPSAIIPVVLGDSGRSRFITRFTLERGGLVNLVEYPAVARNAARFRLQVMASHTQEQIERFVAVVLEATRDADVMLAGLGSGRMGTIRKPSPVHESA
jgi:glycine C-acetyltransferase